MKKTEQRVKGWKTTSFRLTFSNGDDFGAVATSSGQLKVYKNTQLLATVDVTG